MTAVVFLGPSLPWQQAAAIAPNVELWPPAQAGDVYRAVEHRRASALGLIDGVFGTAPSVWHKEILFALSHGVPVWGSSSMGALRAAECAPFGMIGIGDIFESYASGCTVDDDEVAVAHLDEADGFTPVTIPMVTVRRIALLATEASVITAGEAETVIERCKETFYGDRTAERFDEILAESLSPGAVAEVRRISGTPEADPKAQDARMLLTLLADERHAHPTPGDPVLLEETAFWRRLRHEVDLPSVTPWFEDPGASVDLADRVNIVRGALLEPRDADLGIRARLWVHVVQECCALLGIEATAPDIQRKSEEMRREHGLLSASATREWLARRGVSGREWQQALALEVMADKLALEFSAELRGHVAVLVAARGGWNDVVGLSGTPGAAGTWEEQTGRVASLMAAGVLPQVPDLDGLVARLGFTSLTELFDALDRHHDRGGLNSSAGSDRSD